MKEKEILKAEIDKIDNENTIEKILCFVLGISTQQKIDQFSISERTKQSLQVT